MSVPRGNCLIALCCRRAGVEEAPALSSATRRDCSSPGCQIAGQDRPVVYTKAVRVSSVKQSSIRYGSQIRSDLYFNTTTHQVGRNLRLVS